jgi:hypothetical protein
VKTLTGEVRSLSRPFGSIIHLQSSPYPANSLISHFPRSSRSLFTDEFHLPIFLVAADADSLINSTVLRFLFQSMIIHSSVPLLLFSDDAHPVMDFAFLMFPSGSPTIRVGPTSSPVPGNSQFTSLSSVNVGLIEFDALVQPINRVIHHCCESFHWCPAQDLSYCQHHVVFL